MIRSVDDWLAASFFGNPVERWAVAALLFLATVVALRVAKTVLAARVVPFVARASRDLESLLQSLLRHVGPTLYLAAGLDVASQRLDLPAKAHHVIDGLTFLIVAVKLIQAAQDVMLFAIRRSVLRGRAEDAATLTVTRNLSLLAKSLLWIVGLLFIANNVGLEVSSVVAGLGIGGVAVALAAQAVLKDAFSAFAIWMDEPFAIGDFIAVGDMLGSVEYIGFKTTRLRSLSGEQLVFSNADLTDSRIRNYKRMATRRIAFRFGVIYQTPIERLREIPQIVRSIVEAEKLARLDRAHFLSFGESSLDFEVVYYVTVADYNAYMDTQQSINLRLMEEFAARRIEFAYPTRQLYVMPLAPQEPEERADGARSSSDQRTTSTGQ